MERAKVIHIITKMELGGAQQNTLYTVTHLDSQQFIPYLITGRGGELYNEARTFPNIFIAKDLVREIRPVKDIKAFLQLCRLIKKIAALSPVSAPMIVHTHSSKAGILGRWAAWWMSTPIIIHSIHGFGFHDGQPPLVKSFFIWLEKLAALVTTKFIAVSVANRQKGIDLSLFSPQKAVVIRSGIDIKRVQNPRLSRTEFRKSLGIPETAPVVAMIACLKPQKAPLDFIRVCGYVSRELPQTYFLLVGDGELREAVEDEITQRGLRHCLYVLGWRNDIPEILNATDVLVLTSRWEGLPRVFPEAMAAGVPIVATRVDGAPEAIKDGVNGFLLAPGDVLGIAHKTIDLIKNPAHRRRMGLQSYRMVEEFAIERMVQQQMSLYGKLLAEYRAKVS